LDAAYFLFVEKSDKFIGHGLPFLRFGHDRVYVDGAQTVLALVGGGVDLNIESVQRTQDEAELGARMASLNLYDPLAADANALCESRLIELELLAPVANDGTEIGGRANEHGAFPRSQRSLTLPYVRDR
jgi:hypothetical protein